MKYPARAMPHYNTPLTLLSQHHLLGHHKHHDDQTASTTATSEDQNASPADIPSKPTSAGNSGSNDQQGHSTEGGDRGPDPALVGDANPTEKLTGTGEPGSHSALFGLTPDGKKNTETSKGSGAPKAAHSKDTAVGGGKQVEETGSRASSGNAEVSEQMQKAEADPGQKGAQRTDPAPLPAGGDTKPGAGATGLQQGSGKV